MFIKINEAKKPLASFAIYFLIICSVMLQAPTAEASATGTATESGSTIMLGPMPDMSIPRVNRTTADHSQFDELKKKFRKTRDVIKACLKCHNTGAEQIHKTKHWNWDFTNRETGQKLGARNIINNFFMNTASNEASCSHCHIGSGWKGNKFNYEKNENVDCLICHDTTGKYAFKKFHTARGDCGVCHDEVPETPGDKKHKTDMTEIALNVGPTSRRTCGSCHYMGGGGINVKHGDLDSSLTAPNKDLDVHMDVDGLNFSCAECHNSDQHAIRGSRYEGEKKDINGITIPGKALPRRSSCRSCHGDRPMKDNKLNDHTDKIACQTCHIPKIARGGYATKTYWDWSTAGKLDADGNPILERDKNGNVTYSTQKGHSEWAENLQPDYIWSNGNAVYTLLSDKINPDKTVQINRFLGDSADPNALISPVKTMRGKQPYDAGNNTLAAVNMFALHRSSNDTSDFWRNFDWEKAIAKGMKAVKQEFSGEVGFIETEMLWPINHMVAPAKQAVDCIDCHRKNGRLENIEGIYIPGRDSFYLLDMAGWGMLLGTFAGILVHGLLRIFAHKRRNNRSVKS